MLQFLSRLTAEQGCSCPTGSAEKGRATASPSHRVEALSEGWQCRFRLSESIYLGIFLILLIPLGHVQGAEIPTVTRLGNGPIITQNMDDRMGGNVQGPSLIRVPDWIEYPLGKYYLYFADHRGTYIRLAFTDDLLGPWIMYEPGSLQLEQSYFPTTCPPCSHAPGVNAPLYAHIASPDVHVDNENQQLVMYLHGRDVGRQLTRLALSRDGLNFEGNP